MRDQERKRQRQASNKILGIWEATLQDVSCDTLTTIRDTYKPPKEEQTEFMTGVDGALK